MEIKGKTVGELVSADIRTSDAFKKFGIDFCCGGGKTIEQVCEHHHLDPHLLELEINKCLDQKTENYIDYTNMSILGLIEHIVNTHHVYLRENLPIIRQYAKKVAAVHGPSNEHLIQLNELTLELERELMPHLIKEEKVLFPYIKSMVEAEQLDDPSGILSGWVNMPINQMMREHDHAGGLLKQIREVSRNFELPDHACNTWLAYYMKLQDLETDMHLHVHLENNLLFSRVMELENSLLTA